METLLNLGSRSLIKVGGSHCLPIPSFYIKNINTVKGAEFNIDLLDDKSIRITPKIETVTDKRKLNIKSVNSEITKQTMNDTSVQPPAKTAEPTAYHIQPKEEVYK